MEMTAQQESELLWRIEEFGREAIRIFFKEGMDMGLFKPEDHDIIMESLRQKAEISLIEKLQEHFDEHHKEGTECEDYDVLAERFILEKNSEGKVKVISRKIETEGMN
jgi:hypothetical protein